MLLTGGSTTAQMVPHLVAVPDITVVTNSVAIAYAIGIASETTRVLVLGGLMRNNELSLLGHLTTQALKDVHIDVGFFSAYGFDPAYGMLGAHLAEAETDRNMIAAATPARRARRPQQVHPAQRRPHRAAVAHRHGRDRHGRAGRGGDRAGRRRRHRHLHLRGAP